MKKLCELVDIAVNNENCVLFKVKDNVVMDMIALGCFKGDEDMIRMTKGRTPEITVFKKDGSNYSYHFGEGSTTVISDNMALQRLMVRECAVLNFGIVCDLSYMRGGVDEEALIKTSLGIRGADDAALSVSVVSGGGKTGHIKINEQTMAHDVNVKDIPGWFEERGYSVSFSYDISHGLPCGEVRGVCEPVTNAEKEFGVNDISKERYAVLLGNVISFLSEEYGNDKLFYDFLYDEIGMSDEEIRAIGCGDYIPKAVDEVLLSAQEKAEEVNGKVEGVSLDKEPEME